MATSRTPVSQPQQAESDQNIQFPIGRLGAVTRVRNQIQEYLQNVDPNDLESLKSLFTCLLYTSPSPRDRG